MSIAGGTTPTAKLDLTNNDFIIDYTGTSPKDTIRALITSGRAGGAWNGNGITASLATSPTVAHPTALGYAEVP